MPSKGLSVLHTFSHLTLITTLWSRYYSHFQLEVLRFWEVNMLMVTQLRNGRAWIWTRPFSLRPLYTPSSSTSPQPFLIWEPRYGARKIRGPQCQVLKDYTCWYWPAQDPQETGEGLVLAPCLTATWGLMIIISQLSPVTMWEKFRQLRPPPTHGEV